MSRNSGFYIRNLFISLMILFLCLWGGWFIIPDSMIAGCIEKTLAGHGLTVEISGLRKGVFFTVQINRFAIGRHFQPLVPLSSGSEGQPDRPGWLTVRNVTIAPDPFSISSLSPLLNFNGKVGPGVIRGGIAREWGGTVLEIHAAGLQIRDLPFFENAGIQGDGALSFDCTWREEKGNIQFSIRPAALRGDLPGVPSLPLNLFQSVKGALDVGSTIAVRSVAFEGPGIYVRLKGNVIKSVFDGCLEIMLNLPPGRSCAVQALMARYEQSPGYYKVPDVHVDLAPILNQQ